MGKVIATYGGGFKPPTKGHFEVVKKAIKDNPEIDEFIIYVGSKERNGISQAESILIWDIYSKYLPMKVNIEPAKSPIGDVIRLGKNNPENKVYFVIGGREGRQDDFDDIENRTKNIELAYPNMEVKVITTQDKGMSGTNARKAAKLSSDDLQPFLPDELTSTEEEEVFNILRPVVKEQLNENNEVDELESLLNKWSAYSGQYDLLPDIAKLAKNLGVNNGPSIVYRAVPGLDEYPYTKQEVIDYDKEQEIVATTPTKKQAEYFITDNADWAYILEYEPHIIINFDEFEEKYGWSGNWGEGEILIDVTKSKLVNIEDYTKKQSINENASYTKDINLIERLAQLTQHMLDKGMNIEPLPNLEFVNGDSENAREFLGKTAYYDPENKTIVLYTEGRHPKDIARSFSHEMIHHVQNLEGRLGDIQTTNTQEDDNLNDIEAEANLKGTMTFRNWTDSLNESIVGEKIECDNCGWSWNIVDGGDDLFICHKCGHDNNNEQMEKNKDLFGLNQFAREVAEGVLNEGRYDKSSNQFSKIAFEAFKDIHDRGDEEGTFEFSVGPDDEDIYSDQFEFDFEGYVKITDDTYSVNGGANPGFDKKGDEITPLLNLNFEIPKNPTTNPSWEDISFDIKDVVRHELEHLTQAGLNLKGGAWNEDPKLRRPSKQMADDQFMRDLIDSDLLPKSKYYKLEKEVDAMLQGLYFKAKKAKLPFKDVIDDYLDMFVKQKTITQEEKEDILDIWRSRNKALSLPMFENEQNMDYKIFSDMDGVLTDFDGSFVKYSKGIPPREYEKKYGKDGFWKLIDGEGGVGYWAGMPWMEDGKEYWDYIKDYDTELLSSPSRSETSRLGKRLWVKNNMPGVKLTLAQAYNKKNYAEPNHILIDDRESNIEQWREAGGIGILHTSASDTIKQLKALGL
ncbi:MAG: hypothetical protein GY775_14995 [Candidatus Scalindua sp.]|nr:hypothetical protein [Candidatus Scalindua sp.]